MFTPLKYQCIYTLVRRVGKCWHKIICQVKVLFSYRERAIAALRPAAKGLTYGLDPTGARKIEALAGTSEAWEAPRDWTQLDLRV